MYAYRPGAYQGMPHYSDYSKNGRWARRAFPDLTKADHLRIGQDLLKESARLNTEYGKHVERELKFLAARGEHPGPLISGIVSDRFPERVKDGLRAQVRHFNAVRDAAMAHYAASGKRASTFREALGYYARMHEAGHSNPRRRRRA